MTLAGIEDVIVAQISETPLVEKVTWGSIAKMAAEAGVTCTRQWLYANDAIASAYQNHRERRKAVRLGPLDNVAIDPLLSLKCEVAELSATLRAYDERFMRYLYNAQRSGLTVIDLNRSIPARKQSALQRKESTTRS